MQAGFLCEINGLYEHNRGDNPSTRNKGPWKLVYSEEYKTRSEAMKREYEIKAKKSSKSIQQIIEYSSQ